MEPLQWIGLVILLLFFAAMLVALLVEAWPEGAAPWWRKLVNGYGVYAVLGAVIALAIVIPNAERRKGPLVALLFFLLGWLIFLLGHFPLFRGQ